MMNKKTQTRSHGFRLSWEWALVLLVVIAAAIIRVRLLSVPFERDEGEFAYLGQLILQGIAPYTIAASMKLPGIYAAYALSMSIFGQSIEGVRIGLLVVNSATIVMLFLLARRLFDSATAVATSATYAILSVSPGVYGPFAHATHYVVVCAVAGLLLLVKAIQEERVGLLFWSGFCFGLAFLMKQPGIVFCVLGGCLLLLKPRQWSPGKLIKRIGIYAVGAVIPLALTIALIVKAGAFPGFWFWTVDYARAYAGNVPPGERWAVFMSNLPQVVGSCWPIWVMAGLGLAAMFRHPKTRAQWPFVVGLAAFSFAAVCAGFLFRPHYFIVFFPALALLAGIAASSGASLISPTNPPTAARIACAVALGAAVIWPVVANAEVFFSMPPDVVSRTLYGRNPFPESIEIANYIKKHTKETDTIAVLGSEPQIYFYSGRRSATTYIYVYPLVENQRYAKRMQLEMIRQIERAEPKYIVLVDIRFSWAPGLKYPHDIIEWMPKFISRGYAPAGVVDIAMGECTVFYWGDDAVKAQAITGNIIRIYKRKSP